jgi:hypothetical protein
VLCTMIYMIYQLNNLPKPQDREPRKGKARARCWESFIVHCEAATERHPSEAALAHPAVWQRREAGLGLGELHDFEKLAMGRRIQGRLIPGFLLIGPRHLDRVASDVLHPFGPPRRSCALAAVTGQAHREPSGSTAICMFLPRWRVAPSSLAWGHAPAWTVGCGAPWRPPRGLRALCGRPQARVPVLLITSRPLAVTMRVLGASIAPSSNTRTWR